MTEVLLGIAMMVVGALGVVITLVGLPGTWFVLLIALLAQWLAPGEPFTWWTLGAGLLLCVLAEVAEGVSGALGAAKAGASKRALVGAAVGGLVGAIVGTVLLPVPLVGTLVGGAIGAGVGAVALEFIKPKDLRKSRSMLAVGRGAAIGRLLSTVIKSVFAIGLLVLFTVAAFLP
jgi:uncharacterized protein